MYALKSGKKTAPKKLKELDLKMFKMAMIYFAESKLVKHRYRRRCQSHEEIHWKLLKAPNYVEKLQYFDYQIETTVRSMTRDQAEDIQKELKRVRGQILRNQMKLAKRETIKQACSQKQSMISPRTSRI